MTEGGPERFERGCRVSSRPLVPAISPGSFQFAVLRQPHKQVALTNIFVGQHCAIALVAEILAELSQRLTFGWCLGQFDQQPVGKQFSTSARVNRENDNGFRPGSVYCFHEVKRGLCRAKLCERAKIGMFGRAQPLSGLGMGFFQEGFNEQFMLPPFQGAALTRHFSRRFSFVLRPVRMFPGGFLIGNAGHVHVANVVNFLNQRAIPQPSSGAPEEFAVK